MTTRDDPSLGRGYPTSAQFGRRRFLQIGAALAAGAGFGALGACSRASDDNSQPGSASGAPDMEKARSEGLVLWHANQEEQRTEFLKGFTAATGIQATSQRVLPGTAAPKLQQEFQAKKTPSCDVYDCSDVGVMYTLQKQNQLMAYKSPQLSAYAADKKSVPEGYWTFYEIIPLVIQYLGSRVSADEAPKTYEDLLDPRWKGKIGVQDSSSGTAFTIWYELKDKLAPDYFDKLAAQKPRGYSSSTQIAEDLNKGEILIGLGLSMIQYYAGTQNGLPYKLCLPDIGSPAGTLPTGIIAGAAHPNAAKAYIDYQLSQAGQQAWVNILACYSARQDVEPVASMPPLDSIKPLTTAAADPAKAGAPEVRTEFVKVWNNVLGVK